MRFSSHSAARVFTALAFLSTLSVASPAASSFCVGTGGFIAQGAAALMPLSQGELDSLLPASVYYLGKTAPVQLRNAGGVRFSGSADFLAVMVDSSGYSSAIQESYQFYILTEGPVLIGGQRLPAGAYGAGFVNGKLTVMDIGGHPVLQADAQQDAAMARPRPMQVIAATPGSIKLYHGRQWVSVSAATAAK